MNSFLTLLIIGVFLGSSIAHRLRNQNHMSQVGETNINDNDQISAIQLQQYQCKATLYRDAYFSGLNPAYRKADDPNLYQSGLINDAVSSLRVSPGCTATFYWDINYEGASYSYTGNVAKLDDDVNDKFSSMRLTGSATELLSDCLTILYQYVDYKGDTLELTSDTPSLIDYNYNDKVSSLVVSKDCVATLYKDSNYQGGALSYVGANRIAGLLRDEATSLKLSTFTMVTGNDGCAVRLYLNSNYGYHSDIFYSDKDDFGSYNNWYSSLKITPGCTVYLYEYSDYKGGFAVYSENTSTFGGLRNDQFNSLILRGKKTAEMS